MKIRNVGWVVPMVMGVAAVGTVFAFAASHSLAGEERSSAGRARCVSTPLETSRVIDRHTLYIEDRSGNAAVITMGHDCLQRGEPVGFEFVGAAQICNRGDVNVSGSINSVVPVRCMASSVELLDRDQAKAYRNGK